MSSVSVIERCEQQQVMVGASVLSLLLVAVTAVGAAAAESPILLRDVTAETGITFRHHDGSSGEYRIVEYVSTGVGTRVVMVKSRTGRDPDPGNRRGV